MSVVIDVTNALKITANLSSPPYGTRRVNDEPGRDSRCVTRGRRALRRVLDYNARVYNTFFVPRFPHAHTVGECGSRAGTLPAHRTQSPNGVRTAAGAAGSSRTQCHGRVIFPAEKSSP